MKKHSKLFTRQVLAWYSRFGRHDLPWQLDINPYRVWVSEIMLQQTRVNTVIPFFNTFMQHFPDVASLARANIDEVLHLWTGLGYYARARNLHAASRIIMDRYAGRFPETLEAAMELPGIGRSTAGAILAIARQQRYPILDGNVKRVLARFHGIRGWPGLADVSRKLWELADEYTPPVSVAEYTQAIMDLGATVCIRKQPLCGQCPVEKQCVANQNNLQAEIPAPRPARKLPVHSTVFAIVENQQGKILLQQRPATGIWGGLWSFPECEPEKDLENWIRTNLGYALQSVEYKPSFRHTFSHFHLDITPVHIRVDAHTGQEVRDSGHEYWYAATDKRPVGLAAPVRQLLEQVTNPV